MDETAWTVLPATARRKHNPWSVATDQGLPITPLLRCVRYRYRLGSRIPLDVQRE